MVGLAERKTKPFATLIKRLRTERGLTVRQLADMVERTPGYISRIEVHGDIPGAELICSLATAFRVSPEDLLDEAARQALRKTEESLRHKYEAALALYRKTE